MCQQVGMKAAFFAHTGKKPFFMAADSAVSRTRAGNGAGTF